MRPLIYRFDIAHSGEPGAGLRPYTDTVAITVQSGDVGGDTEFIEHMRQALAQWYDGATVVFSCMDKGE